MAAIMPLASPAARVSAEETPAPAEQTYEYDGVTYRNMGNEANEFSKKPEDYYKAMLSNPLSKGGITDPDFKDYSISDL